MTGAGMIGAGAFLAGNEAMAGMTREQVLDAVRPRLGAAAEDAYARYEPGTPAAIASALSDEFFRDGDRLAGGLAPSGNAVYAYSFDHRPAGSPFGACHCLELPFVFGNPQSWSDAPMLGTEGVPDGLVDAVQRPWIAFIRTGDPGWPLYTGERDVQHIG
ncbi:carboxylesterase family protein [Pseudonocardia sp. GCM10023141]|uniref:carboxylesterase family protein n=1 Tax=Pseudonocardia sp. GCM10023141 TaxID=3252653 RepID=UPI0036208796